MKKAGVIIGIIVVLALLLVPQYNGLVQSKEDVNEAYAQVQNVVQRRADLIPNLVNTAKDLQSTKKMYSSKYLKLELG